MEIINKYKVFLYWIIAVGFLTVFVFLLANKKDTVKDIPTVPVAVPVQNPVTLNTQIKQVKIGGVTLSVDLAITPAAQQQGLSGRSGLAADSAMLFVFSTPGRDAFWMKDMNFPIDMIWIGPDMKVVYIKKNATPESYPEAFMPPENDLYVLETVSGFAEKNNVKVGDTVQFGY